MKKDKPRKEAPAGSATRHTRRRAAVTAPRPPDPLPGGSSSPAADDPRAMRTPQAILLLIEQTVHNVIAETIAPDKARILIYAAQTAAAALKALIIDKAHEELERRIDEIEKRADEWHNKL